MPKKPTKTPTGVPSLEQRIDVLRELFPLLPLQEPRRPYMRTSALRGRPVAPWILSDVSVGNPDDTDQIAARIGTPEEVVIDQFEQLCNEHRTVHLKTREVLATAKGLERVITFEQFAAFTDGDDDSQLWWGLSVPVLKPTLDVAYLSIQLCGRYGADDFAWVARKARGKWRLEAVSSPSSQS